MKTIFTVGAVVLATCLLSGCVNEQKVNQLASNVQTLNAKIARLEQDMKALRPQIYAAKSEATEPIRVLMLRTILIACAACVCTQNDKKIPGSVSVAGDIF
ncbi:putative lipoprotein [Escherichia coli]|uniref:Putative lipoprotein n=1 Tax=Escherichia coli TaxID=562 RepID=A0A377DN60_ECOLX|nr:putative lipoprotein [Escherichia coli]